MRTVSASRSASASHGSRSTAPRSAAPGRTGRRSATGGAPRRRHPKRAARAVVERPASTRRTAPRWRASTSSSVAKSRASSSSLVASASAKWSRAPRARAAWLRRRASSRTWSATSAPTCFDASHAACRRSRRRRWCAGSSRIALSSTGSPSISPRNVLNVDSTSVSSSTSCGAAGRPAPGGGACGRTAPRAGGGAAGRAPLLGSARRGSAANVATSPSASRNAMSVGDPASLVLVRDRGAGEPPRLVRGDLERPQTGGDGASTRAFQLGHRRLGATGTRCAGSRGSSGGGADRRAAPSNMRSRICGKPSTLIAEDQRAAGATWMTAATTRDGVAPLLLVGDAERRRARGRRRSARRSG